GKRRRRVCIGEESRPNWKYGATRKAEAESAPIIKKPVAFAPKKGRDRKSLKGSIGSVARASHTRNALKEMTPTASAPSVIASVQPVSAARTSPQTSDSAPTEP